MYKITYQSAKKVDDKIDVKTYDSSLEATKDKLRELRKTNCFDIVNRGRLWYNRLTTEQYVELDLWYQKWLDVTDTLKIPQPLTWINDKLYGEDVL